MNKFLHYLLGIGLVIFGLVMFSWFYYIDNISYSITHITNPMHFARTFSPIASMYLGIFYLYNAIKNKISLLSKASLYVLVIGLLTYTALTSFVPPTNIGGTIPHYVLVLDSISRKLIPLTIVVSIVLSFVSLFKKSSS